MCDARPSGAILQLSTVAIEITNLTQVPPQDGETPATERTLFPWTPIQIETENCASFVLGRRQRNHLPVMKKVASQASILRVAQICHRQGAATIIPIMGS